MTTTNAARIRYRKHYEGNNGSTTVEIVKEGSEFRVEICHFSKHRGGCSTGIARVESRAEAIEVANLHADLAKKNGLTFKPEKTQTEYFDN